MFKAKTAGPPDPNAKPKTPFEAVLTSTPVIMTIVATLLAGLSTGEMTRAQYHRSLAAQHQSKSGDQWSLFQAKRIRGTIQDMTVVQLHGMPSTVDAGTLQQSAERLLRDLQRGAGEAKRLNEKIASARGELGAAADKLAQAADRFLTATQQKVAQAETVNKQLAGILSDSKVSEAFVFLTSDKLPVPAEISKSAELDPRIKETSDAIAQRQREDDIEKVVGPVPEAALIDAINDAAARAQVFENATRPVTQVIRQLDKIMRDETLLARSFDRSTRDLLAAVADANGAEGQGLNEVRRTADSIKQTAASLKSSVDEVTNDYQAAVISFNSRRYERESRDNQAIANLYEIQVAKSSWNSNRHITRSRLFFFGMLAAQAGVTIASLALAVRLKSVLWTIACVAGVLALAIGAYVYVQV